MTNYPIAHSTMTGGRVSANTTPRRARGKVKKKWNGLSEIMPSAAFPVWGLFFFTTILSAQIRVSLCTHAETSSGKSGAKMAVDESWPEWVYDEDPDIESMEALVGHRVRHRRAQQRRNAGGEKKNVNFNAMSMDQPRTPREAGVKSGEW